VGVVKGINLPLNAIFESWTKNMKDEEGSVIETTEVNSQQDGVEKIK